MKSSSAPLEYGVEFQKWLASQSDDDLRQALREDVGEMIRNGVREEIEGRYFTTPPTATASGISSIPNIIL